MRACTALIIQDDCRSPVKQTRVKVLFWNHEILDNYYLCGTSKWMNLLPLLKGYVLMSVTQVLGCLHASSSIHHAQFTPGKTENWTFIGALFIRMRTNRKLQSEGNRLWPTYTRETFIRRECMQNMWFPHPRSKLVQHVCLKHFCC